MLLTRAKHFRRTWDNECMFICNSWPQTMAPLWPQHSPVTPSSIPLHLTPRVPNPDQLHLVSSVIHLTNRTRCKWLSTRKKKKTSQSDTSPITTYRHGIFTCIWMICVRAQTFAHLLRSRHRVGVAFHQLAICDSFWVRCAGDLG